MTPHPALPAAAGIGLRAPHVREVLAAKPAIPWFEVHSENYFAAGGATGVPSSGSVRMRAAALSAAKSTP